MANQATEMKTTTPIPPDLREPEEQQKIAELAFQYWLARGFRKGSPETDWLRAEREVRGTGGTVRLKRTSVGLFLVAPPCS